jgi:RNA recognition motif-containing protein
MQGSKLFIGNLNYSVTKRDLEELFSQYGVVRDIKIIEDKGFGFVEMSSQGEAEKVKEALDGTQVKGRAIKIDEAKPPKPKAPRRDNRRY